MLLQPDGKIIVGGYFNGVNIERVGPIVRFQADGSLDTSFDASALSPAPLDPSGGGGFVPFALQPNGQVLITPGLNNFNYRERLLFRLNADGGPDVAFQPQFGGIVVGNPRIDQAAVLSDGRILVSGFFHTVNGMARANLARLNPNGTLDPTFVPARTGTFALLTNGQLIVASDKFYRLNADGTPSIPRFRIPGRIARRPCRFLLSSPMAGSFSRNRPARSAIQPSAAC